MNGSYPTSQSIIAIRDQPIYLERAISYFSSKWGIAPEVYRKSISDGISTTAPLPRWYLLILNDEIIGSYGLIENDFMIMPELKDGSEVSSHDSSTNGLINRYKAWRA